MHREVFSSGALPSALSPEQRARRWAETINAAIGASTVDIPDQRAFHGRTELLIAPDAVVGSAAATSIRLTRSADHIRRDGNDSVMLLLATGARPLGGLQLGREVAIARGGAALFVGSEAHCTYALRGGKALSVTLPAARIAGRVRHLEDRAARPLDPASEALRLLTGYLQLLLAQKAPAAPPVMRSVASHLSDLAVLALSEVPASGPLTAHGAVRAARVAAIEAEMGRRFEDPDLGPDTIAGTVGISPRTLQYLLQETGTTFRQRLTELRLRRALELLSDPAHLDLSVADIAFAVGYGDSSAFHRAFRARYGDTPASARPGRREV
jgi:AraC-like DNA-binding protein